MSVLLHLCLTCRHRATSHGGADRGYSACRCCLGPGDIDPAPRLVETFRSPGAAREPLYPPGTLWNAGTMHKLVLCDCGACHEAFRTLTAAGEELSQAGRDDGSDPPA